MEDSNPSASREGLRERKRATDWYDDFGEAEIEIALRRSLMPEFNVPPTKIARREEPLPTERRTSFEEEVEQLSEPGKHDIVEGFRIESLPCTRAQVHLIKAQIEYSWTDVTGSPSEEPIRMFDPKKASEGPSFLGANGTRLGCESVPLPSETARFPSLNEPEPTRRSTQRSHKRQARRGQVEPETIMIGLPPDVEHFQTQLTGSLSDLAETALNKLTEADLHRVRMSLTLLYAHQDLRKLTPETAAYVAAQEEMASMKHVLEQDLKGRREQVVDTLARSAEQIMQCAALAQANTMVRTGKWPEPCGDSWDSRRVSAPSADGASPRSPETHKESNADHCRTQPSETLPREECDTREDVIPKLVESQFIPQVCNIAPPRQPSEASFASGVPSALQLNRQHQAEIY